MKIIFKIKNIIKNKKNLVINSLIMAFLGVLLIGLSLYFKDEIIQIGDLSFNTTKYLILITIWCGLFLILSAIVAFIENETKQQQAYRIFGFFSVFALGYKVCEDKVLLIFLIIGLLLLILWVFINNLIKCFGSFLLGIVISALVLNIIHFLFSKNDYNSIIENKIYCVLFAICLNLYLKFIHTKLFNFNDTNSNKLYIKIFYLIFIILTFIYSVDIQYSTFLLVAYLMYDIDWKSAINKN